MCLFTDEGEYICSVCTVFGLERDEIQVLIENGMRCTDHNKESEGYEVQNSAFRVTKNILEVLILRGITKFLKIKLDIDVENVEVFINLMCVILNR